MARTKTVATSPGEASHHVALSPVEEIERDTEEAEARAKEARQAPMDARMSSLVDGGYGTVPEQLEMIAEQGVVAYQAHIAAVKVAHPKVVVSI